MPYYPDEPPEHPLLRAMRYVIYVTTITAIICGIGIALPGRPSSGLLKTFGVTGAIAMVLFLSYMSVYKRINRRSRQR